MEEDQGLKHVCKFCRKSFPCGRSLGGHMRSHNMSETDDKLITKKKLVSLLHNVNNETTINGGYILRDNPKKTWRLAADHSSEEEEETNQKLVMDDSQSDNETAAEAAVPSKRRRSRRRTIHTANPSTFSSMSEIEQEQEREQEEVALSLMMLSRDVDHWGCGIKIPIKASSICNRKEVFMKLKKQKQKKVAEHATMESYVNPELKSCSVNKLTAEFCKDPRKRSKFECSACNRIFHSYQALGGHRASHKKTKGCCFASRIGNGSENSVETEHSPDPTINDEIHCDDDEGEISYGVNIKTRSKGHECPICLKVFQSGQALGGHKRSHFVAEAKENQAIVIQKPIQEIRDFLDLNLPAPVEDETGSVDVGFKPWWVGSGHKHEALVGLISN